MPLPKINSAKFTWENSFQCQMEPTPDYDFTTWPTIKVKPPWRPTGYTDAPHYNRPECVGIMFERGVDEALWCHFRADLAQRIESTEEKQ